MTRPVEEVVRIATAPSGPDVDPARTLLIAHAAGLDTTRGRGLVLSALSIGASKTFDELARLVGSRVVARYAVLQLAGRGDVVIRTPGHLVRSSVIASPAAARPVMSEPDGVRLGHDAGAGAPVVATIHRRDMAL